MLFKGWYSGPNCSLNVRILQIHYQTPEYVKAKVMLTDKKGNVYEVKNYKLLKKNITHWVRIQSELYV